MGRKHQKTDLDRARDELMSHVVRCGVLDARMEDRDEWLGDTLDYLRDSYPTLSQLQFAQLEMIGKQFIQPPIPHGAGEHADNRPEPTVLTSDGERVSEGDLELVEVGGELQVA